MQILFGRCHHRAWDFSNSRLNSFERCLHRYPIKPVFYWLPQELSLFEAGFSLRCFQTLSLSVWLPSYALSDNWYTRDAGNTFLSYLCPLLLRQLTLLLVSNRTVSRRSEPSSRALLIGEHPHPWLLVHSQDRTSRQRCSKRRGRSILQEEIISSKIRSSSENGFSRSTPNNLSKRFRNPLCNAVTGYDSLLKWLLPIAWN